MNTEPAPEKRPRGRPRKYAPGEKPNRNEYMRNYYANHNVEICEQIRRRREQKNQAAQPAVNAH